MANDLGSFPKEESKAELLIQIALVGTVRILARGQRLASSV